MKKGAGGREKMEVRRFGKEARRLEWWENGILEFEGGGMGYRENRGIGWPGAGSEGAVNSNT